MPSVENYQRKECFILKQKIKRTHFHYPIAYRYLTAIIFWIVVWQSASLALSKELLLPSPVKTIRVLFYELIPSAFFWLSIRNSLFRIGLGFLSGMLAGIMFAIFSARHEYIRLLLWLPVRLIQSVPVASFVILILLWIPASSLSTAISFLMVLPVIYNHTLTGIGQLDTSLTEAAILFRIPLWKRVLHIYIPQLLPHICSACVLASGMAWKSGIAAEIIGLSKNSIGNQLYQAKIYLMTPQLFAWTLVIVLLSIFCEWLIRFLARILSDL